MTFRDSVVLPDNPFATVLFSGLLFLRADDHGDFCDVGVHRSSPDHYLSFEVRKKNTDRNIPDVVIMRHLGPVEFERISIATDGSTHGVFRYNPPGTFNRAVDGDARDLRWALDLESHEFHDQLPAGTTRLKLDKFATAPDIRVLDGIFFAALKTDKTKLKVERQYGNKPNQNLYSIAALIGCNIYLGDRVPNLILNWTDAGHLRELKLARADAAGGYFEIYINNDPPFMDPAEVSHKEFPEYYKALPDVRTDDRFNVDVSKIVTPPVPGVTSVPPGLGSPNIPCMPVIMDGPP